MTQNGSERGGARGTKGRSGTRQGFRSRDDKPTRPINPQKRASKALKAKPAAKPRPARIAATAAKPAQKALPPDVAPKPTRAEARAAASEVLATGVQTLQVEPDEADMRVDRFLVARFPQLAFTHIQRIVRKGELRIDGRRAKPNERLVAGQKIRIPPLKLDQPRPISRAPAQGPGRTRLPQVDHALRGQGRPRHQQADGPCGAGRIGHDTPRGRHSGSASRRRGAEAASRSPARQGYGRLPRHRQDALCRLDAWRNRSAPARREKYTGRWSPACRASDRVGFRPTWRRRGEEGDSRMRVSKHGAEGASHALTYYAIVETAATKASLAVAEARHRAHPPAARPRGAYWPSDRRRSEIFRHRKLGAAGRHPEQAASAGAPDRHRASSHGQAARHHRAASAAYAAELQPARFRHQPLRSYRRGAGGLDRATTILSSYFCRPRGGESDLPRRILPGLQQGGGLWNTSFLISSVALPMYSRGR